MNISITFRQMDPSEAIKKYATTKIARLQKLLDQPMEAKLTFSVQKQRHITEVQISSGRRRVEARESSEEMYAAIDQVMDKLERQINGEKSTRVTKTRRAGVSVRQLKPVAIPPSTATAKKTAKKVAKKKPVTERSRARS